MCLVEHRKYVMVVHTNTKEEQSNQELVDLLTYVSLVSMLAKWVQLGSFHVIFKIYENWRLEQLNQRSYHD